ncbi:hypothetical protein PSPO01_11967 [Paraphaeosphaeria sporulosa]
MMLRFLFYAFGWNSRSLRNVIRHQALPGPAMKVSVECVQLTGQRSSTCATGTLVGRWQFSWSSVSFRVYGVPHIPPGVSGRHNHTILTVRHLSLMGMPPPLPDMSVPNPLTLTGWRHRRPVTLSATAAHPHSGIRPVLPCHLSVVHHPLHLQGALHNRSISLS